MNNIEHTETLKDYRTKIEAQFKYILEDYALCPQLSRKDYINGKIMEAKALNMSMINDDINSFKNKDKNKDFEKLAEIIVDITQKHYISKEKGHEIIDLLNEQRKINFVIVDYFLDTMHKATKDSELREYKENMKVKTKLHEQSIVLYKNKIDNKITLKDTIKNIFGMRKNENDVQPSHKV